MTLKYSSSIKQWRQYKSIFNIPYYLLKKCNLGILSKDAFHINELDKDHTELSINNFLFDDICFEKLISEILNDQQIETKPFYFELIFKILMK